MKFIICILSTLFTSYIRGQKLTFGDTIPDVVVNDIYNYKSPSLKMSDFRGKLVILDFWGFSCAGCLAGFPKLENIQKHFDKEIQVILVNAENKRQTDSFFSKRIKVLKPPVPMITNDTLFHSLFRFQSTPTNVWIDKLGIVTYLADGSHATIENIDKYLSGQNIQLPKAKPTKYVESFFDQQYQSSLIKYIYLSKWAKEIRLQQDSDEKESIAYCCSTPIELYQHVFGDMVHNQYNFSNPKRTIVQNYDPEKYVRPSTEFDDIEWGQNHLYDLQYLCKECNEKEKYQEIINFLNKYFNLKARIEHVKLDCWILVKIGNLSNLKTKGGTPKSSFFTRGLKAAKEDSICNIVNKPFSYLVDNLKTNIELNYSPFFNAVGFAGKIDLKMSANLLDSFSIKSIKTELRKHNLDLIKEIRSVPVLKIVGQDTINTN